MTFCASAKVNRACRRTDFYHAPPSPSLLFYDILLSSVFFAPSVLSVKQPNNVSHNENNVECERLFYIVFFCCFSCSSFHWFCFSCLCCAMWISKKILYEIGTNHKTITNEKMKLCVQTFFHVSFSFFFSLWRMKVKTPNESSMILLWVNRTSYAMYAIYIYIIYICTFVAPNSEAFENIFIKWNVLFNKMCASEHTGPIFERFYVSANNNQYDMHIHRRRCGFVVAWVCVCTRESILILFVK